MKEVSLGKILKNYGYKSIWRQLDVWILVLQYCINMTYLKMRVHKNKIFPPLANSHQKKIAQINCLAFNCRK